MLRAFIETARDKGCGRLAGRVLPSSSSSAGRWLCGVVAVSCLVVVACGSESDDGGLLPPVEDPESSELSSEAVSSEAGSTSSTSEPEPAESTVSPVPIEKPLLEIPDEWDDDWAEIEGRYLLYTQAFLVAASPPAADPDYPQLEELVTASAFDDVNASLQRMADEPVVLVAPDDRPTEHVVWLPNPSVLSKEEGNEVVLQDCYINGLLALDLDGEVIQDEPQVYLQNLTMKVEGGEWRLFSIRRADPGSGGQQECLDVALARSLPDSYSLPELE